MIRDWLGVSGCCAFLGAQSGLYKTLGMWITLSLFFAKKYGVLITDDRSHTEHVSRGKSGFYLFEVILSPLQKKSMEVFKRYMDW